MLNLIARAGLVGALALMLTGCAVGLNDPDPREAPAIAGGHGSVGPILLDDVYLYGPVVGGGSPRLALTVSNQGEHSDRLVAATSPDAAAVRMPRGGVAVPALGTVDLQNGRTFALRDVHRSWVDGTAVPIRFRFAHAGAVTVYAAVENHPGIS